MKTHSKVEAQFAGKLAGKVPLVPTALSPQFV